MRCYYKVMNRFLPNVPEFTEACVENTSFINSSRACSRFQSFGWDLRFGNKQQTIGAKEGESSQCLGAVLGSQNDEVSI